ncbi:hypothetical protein GF326_07205 [Candidatus Bathyarchaeota archaeon]|nr:hypothetical protein [Candidatus Bathyarchaeota archaeon]
MCEWVRQSIIDRLNGRHIHLRPYAAFEGLSSAEAKKTVKGTRSVLELLYHIVYWLEYSLALLRSKEVEHVEDADWDIEKSSWEDLLARFIMGKSRLEFIAENWDLDREVRISDGSVTCVGAELLGVIQHNSYHLGQIISTRRVLGLWPKK